MATSAPTADQGAYFGPMAPQTPEQWIDWLQGRLQVQRRQSAEFLAHYDGEIAPLAFAQKKFSDEFGDLFTRWRVNISQTIIDVLAERINVRGFRMTEEERDDKEANEIWQKSSLDSEFPLTVTETLACGRSFLKVWGDEDDNPVITPESSLEVAVQYYPGSRTKVYASLKWYTDEWGAEWSELYFPDRVYKYVRPGLNKKLQQVLEDKNPIGKNPIVPFLNRERLTREPQSELKNIIPLERAIGKLAADMLVASEFLSYPQRILSGIELFEDENGKLIAPIQSAIDRLLVFEETDVKWGQFQSADLRNYVDAITLLIQLVCTISRIPPHYMLTAGGSQQAPSGESIDASEAGLVSKAAKRQRVFEDRVEEAMRLAFAIKGDKRKAESWSAEVIWEDPQRRSEAVATDAAVKKVQAGIIPKLQAAEDLGYTSAQMERWGTMFQEQQELDLQRQRAMVEIASYFEGPDPGGNSSSEVKSAPSNRGNAARKTGELER